jgi:pre-mRNA-processing factor 19
MAAVCAISGVPPEEPVVSLKSGYVFEKRLIIKQLKQTGKCPMTNEDLRPEDLLPLKVNSAVKPRPATSSSIPGMLQVFQNEWDAVMLEAHTLKQHLEHLRQELAHALYKHDAACRVIARLIKERDDARKALGSTQGNIAQAIKASQAPAEGQNQGAVGMDTEDQPAMPHDVVEKMSAFAGGLSKTRKTTVKNKQAKVAPKDKISALKQVHDAPLHNTTHPGIATLDLSPSDADLVLTGGNDGQAIIYNWKTGKQVDNLKSHKKRLTGAQFHPTEPLIVTCGVDSVNIWAKKDKGKYAVAHSVTDHKSEIVGCSIHPSGDFFVTAAVDKIWSMLDLKSGKTISQVADSKVDAAFSSVSFHPDGLILGVGSTDSILRVYDVKMQKNVANFTGHTGTVTSLCFSENGYHLASSDDQGVVKLWDLRKLNNLHTIQAKDFNTATHVHFDQSASYLAVSGSGVRIYGAKDWDLITSLNQHTDTVQSVKFGPDAAFLASVSSDRHVKIYS